MDKFPMNSLIDFIATFFKKLLDAFKALSDWADKKYLEDEETTAA